jgi:hypothetical protein
MNKTILDYEEATSIAPDDYIVMDSPSGGTSKVLASTFGDYRPPAPQLLYDWDFTQSIYDKVNNKEALLLDGAAKTDEGVTLLAKNQMIKLTDINLIHKRIEIDVASIDFQGNGSKVIRFLISTTDKYREDEGLLLYSPYTKGWSVYGNIYPEKDGFNKYGNQSWINKNWNDSLSGDTYDIFNAFNNSTVRLDFPNERKTVLYLNDIEQGINNTTFLHSDETILYIGGGRKENFSYGDLNDYNQFYNSIISGIRIYSIPEEPMTYSEDLIYYYNFSQGLNDILWNTSYSGNFNYDNNKISLAAGKNNFKTGIKLGLNWKFEVEVGSMDNQITGTGHGRFLMCNTESGLIYRLNHDWQCYFGEWIQNTITSTLDLTNGNLFENSTVTLYVNNDGDLHIYKDNVLFWKANIKSFITRDDLNDYFRIGSSAGAQFYNCEIKSIKAYYIKPEEE